MDLGGLNEGKAATIVVPGIAPGLIPLPFLNRPIPYQILSFSFHLPLFFPIISLFFGVFLTFSAGLKPPISFPLPFLL